MNEKIEYPKITEEQFWKDFEDICRKSGHVVIADAVRERNYIRILSFIESLMRCKK